MPHEVPSFSEQMRQASAVGGASVAQIDEARPQEEQEEASMAGPTADQIKAFCASAEALVAWEVKERSGDLTRHTHWRGGAGVHWLDGDLRGRGPGGTSSSRTLSAHEGLRNGVQVDRGVGLCDSGHPGRRFASQRGRG
ncbi:unnamed protein product [Durusdinium trenchii]|uniref:Uncharacterized protein n=1 Tax=Durusdinium trenchii TaxID=1381693 RepID=A0ABP0RMZ7_9DINO